MKCPVCTNVELRIADRQGIEIDYCPQCRGVWLDRGELDKIIERSNAQMNGRSFAPPPPDDGADGMSLGPPSSDIQRRMADLRNRRSRRDSAPQDDRRAGQPNERQSILDDLFNFFD